MLTNQAGKNEKPKKLKFRQIETKYDSESRLTVYCPMINETITIDECIPCTEFGASVDRNHKRHWLMCARPTKIHCWFKKDNNIKWN